MGTGAKIALAAAGGLLVGGATGYMFSNMHAGWNGFGEHCSADGSPVSCNDCPSQHGSNRCFIEFAPPTPFARDDVMTTGFIPADFVGPVTINFTAIVGQDFLPSKVCPPVGWTPGVSQNVSKWNLPVRRLQNVSRWTPPEGHDLFASLTRVEQLEDEPPSTPGANHAHAIGVLVLLCACCCCVWLFGYAASRQTRKTTRQAGGAGAPVPAATARGFIDALRDEYVRGFPGAVGEFLDDLLQFEQAELERFEEGVRDSPDPERAIDLLASDWNLLDGGFGDANEGGYHAVAPDEFVHPSSAPPLAHHAQTMPQPRADAYREASPSYWRSPG